MENIKRVKTISETHLDPVKYSELPDEALVHMLRAYTIVEASCHLTGHESGELVYIKQRLRNINAELLSRGVVTDEGSSLIEKEFVRNFLESPKWSPDKYNSVRHIFITLDPNCSNSPTSSDMAMVAVAPVGLQRVVRMILLAFYYYCLRYCTRFDNGGSGSPLDATYSARTSLAYMEMLMVGFPVGFFHLSLSSAGRFSVTVPVSRASVLIARVVDENLLNFSTSVISTCPLTSH